MELLKTRGTIRTTALTQKELLAHDASVYTHFFLSVLYANEKAYNFIDEFMTLLKEKNVCRHETALLYNKIKKEMAIYKRNADGMFNYAKRWYRSDFNQGMDNISGNITEKLQNVVARYAERKGIDDVELYKLNEMALVTADIARLTYQIFERKQKEYCLAQGRKFINPFPFNPSFEGLFRNVMKMSDMLYIKFGWMEIDPNKDVECAELLGEYQHAMFCSENLRYAIKYADIQKDKREKNEGRETA